MSKQLAAIMAMLLSACAAQEEAATQDEEQAVRDYILVRGLPEVKDIRSSNYDRWDDIDPHFIIYETRRESYLVEFVRACYELYDSHVVADRRRDLNRINARFDTIRGCRIEKIFALTEADMTELKTLGESPGSRN
jgi:hypothetical protein